MSLRVGATLTMRTRPPSCHGSAATRSRARSADREPSTASRMRIAGPPSSLSLRRRRRRRTSPMARNARDPRPESVSGAGRRGDRRRRGTTASRPIRAAIRAAGGGVSPVEASRPRPAGAKTASGGPSATTSPSRMTTIRLNWRAANSMSWVMAMTERPAARNASTTAPTRATPSGSWPVVGSSRTRTAGSIARMPASATSFRRDRSRSYGFVARWSARPTASRLAGRRAPRSSAADHPEVARSERDLALDRPLEQLLVRVLEDEPDGRREVRHGSAGRRSSPSSRTRPAAGRSSPLRCLTRVVLPEPFWPRMATASPGSMVSDDAADGLDAARVAMDEVLDGDADGRALAAGRPADGVGRGRAVRRRPGCAGPRRARPAGRPRSPPRRRRGRGRSRPPAASRTSVGGGEPGRAPPPPGRRPGRPSATVRPPSSTRQPVHPAEHGRVVLGAQDRGPGAGQLVEQVGDRRGPGRVELRGRLVEDEDATSPSPRCSRWRPAAARRRTARTARGRRGGRSPAGRGSRRSARPSPSRGTPRFSSPNASSSRTVSFEADSWLAGVAKTIPTRPSSASGAAPAVAIPSIATRPSSLARTTRGMNPAAASARVDLPAPVRPATPTRSPAATVSVDVRRGRLLPARVADARGPRSQQRASAGRRGSGLVIAADAGDRRRRTTPTAGDEDHQPEPAVDRRVGHDAVGGPPRPRPEPARLERERPLADVHERAEHDRPDERDERPEPPPERALERSPRACWASRIDPARSCIRGTIWTADRTTNEIRWLAPRAMSDSSRSSARVVNRKAIAARKTTRIAPAGDEPEGQALTRERERPDRQQDVRRAREEEPVDDQDRDQQEGRDAHRPERRPEQAGRPDGGQDRDGQDRQDERRQQERGQQDEDRARGAWSAGSGDGASSTPRRNSRWPRTSLARQAVEVTRRPSPRRGCTSSGR